MLIQKKSRHWSYCDSRLIGNTARIFVVLAVAILLCTNSSAAAVISVTAGDMPIITDSDGEEFTGNVNLDGDLNVSVGAFDYVVVGGGGGGAGYKWPHNNKQGGGGGGGGGVSYGTFTLTNPNAFTIVVGDGGAGGDGSTSPYDGGSGGTSSISGVASATGGAGGKDYTTGSPDYGKGGASGTPSAKAGGAGGSGTNYGGGGGAGAGEDGFVYGDWDGDGDIEGPNSGGAGGDGLSVTLNGWNVGTFGGGGGGSPGKWDPGEPGLGGAGGGADSTQLGNGNAGTDGLGGGGSAAWTNNEPGNGGAGGSGVVYTRYFGTTAATGGTITDNGEFTYHKFSGDGTFGGLTTPSDQVATFSGDLSGGYDLTKDGDGTLVLSGTNSYSGTTTVDNGTLLVNGTHTGGGMYTVNGSGVLGGIGSLDANVLVDGGILSPGNSIGTLTVSGDVQLPGTLLIELDGLSGTADLLSVSGVLDITGATLDFDVLSTLDDPAYVFADYGTLVGNPFATVLDTPTGYYLDYAYSGNQVALVSETAATAIPEPSTFTIASLGLLGLAWFGWRKRK